MLVENNETWMAFLQGQCILQFPRKSWTESQAQRIKRGEARLSISSLSSSASEEESTASRETAGF